MSALGIRPAVLSHARGVADPLTGLQAALAVAESLNRGGDEPIELSMAAVVAGYAALPRNDENDCSTTPLPSPPAPPASELGVDNARIEQLICERRLISC